MSEMVTIILTNPNFRFCPPIYFLPPHGIFWEEEVAFFWPEKTLKFVISVKKSLRILAKTFFFPFFLRLPGFGRKICDFGQKKPSDFGENLCPPNFNFAPPDLAKLATPLSLSTFKPQSAHRSYCELL